MSGKKPAPDPYEHLDRNAVADLCGYINPNTITVYVGRKTFPPADGKTGGSKYWYRKTVEEFIATRPRVGQPRRPRGAAASPKTADPPKVSA